ncbi:lasso RiPP family leader peptide-containing protein [Nocardia sp. NPDC051570]
MDQNEMYEPPQIVKVGDFAELTRGGLYGQNWDGGETGFRWYEHTVI